MKGGGSLFSRPIIEETVHTPPRILKFNVVDGEVIDLTDQEGRAKWMFNINPSNTIDSVLNTQLSYHLNMIETLQHQRPEFLPHEDLYNYYGTLLSRYQRDYLELVAIYEYIQNLPRSDSYTTLADAYILGNDPNDDMYVNSRFHNQCNIPTARRINGGRKRKSKKMNIKKKMKNKMRKSKRIKTKK